MTSLETKREEFRKYLERAGVIDGLSKALIKLYEEPNKPNDAVRFVRQYMCESCPTDEEFETLKADLDEANNTIYKLERELSTVKGNLKRTPSEIEMLLENGMDELEADDECKSLLKKHLARDVFEKLKESKTGYGSNLLDCIQSGLENHDSKIGVYAADPEAYDMFATVFDPIIEEYHSGFKKDDIHPPVDWGDPTTFGNLDPDNEYIVSTRIRCCRNVEGYAFNPKLTEPQYEELMAKAQDILENLEGDYKGKFYPVLGMDKALHQKLIDDHYLFKDEDRFLESARGLRFWPVGRAIFLNDDKTFIVWVNEEDHIRMISMQMGGDLGAVYQRLVTGVEKISEHYEFYRHNRLGFTTFCPSNLGTTIRASVHINLPLLSADMSQLEEVTERFQLQIRGTKGENSETEAGVFDISNKRRMGLTEYEAVREMYDGIAELIKIEKEM